MLDSQDEYLSCPLEPVLSGFAFLLGVQKVDLLRGVIAAVRASFFRLAPPSLDQRRAAPPRAAAAVKSALDSPELECVSDAAADGDGDAPLTLYPRRRRSLSLDSALIVHRPLSIFSRVLA